MIPLASAMPQERALELILEWFALLAAGRWPEAMARLDQPNGYGITWTPEMIRRVVEQDTFGPETIFGAAHPGGIVYTAPDDAPGPPDAQTYPYDDGSGFSIECPVPLNGEWSELTAIFEFRRRPGGYAVILDDLHVL